MSLIESIILGIVQGLTEFLPISSSGHLRIVPAFAGWDDPGAAFTAFTQLGTTAAVLLYFWRDLHRVLFAWSRSVAGLLRSRRMSFAELDADARIGWFIVIGTIPICVFGLAFSDQIESGARDLYLIGTLLIVVGIVMFAVDRTAHQDREVELLRPRDAAMIGMAQAAALIPGVSRSGATITAGLALGLERGAAARFSFLLSVPAIVLSALYTAPDALSSGPGDPGIGALLIATAMAFVSGYWAISFLIRWLSVHSLSVFVGYRLVLGTAVLVLVVAGTIS